MSTLHHSRHSDFYLFLKKDGNQNEQQNPKCKQFLLFATRQAPENYRCTLRCVFPPPNPFVFFPLGRQGAPRLACLKYDKIEMQKFFVYSILFFFYTISCNIPILFFFYTISCNITAYFNSNTNRSF